MMTTPLPRKRQVRRPNGAPSSNLNIRVPTELLEQARATAARRGETLSRAVVERLEAYVADDDSS